MDWNHVYSNLKHLANRAAVKINQTADIATLQVRVSMSEKKLEEAYAALGRVSYEHFTSDADHSERVAQAVSGVNDALLALRTLKAELDAAKKRAEESKTQSETETVTETVPEETSAPVPEREESVFATEQSVEEAEVSPYSEAEDTVEILVEETE